MSSPLQLLPPPVRNGLTDHADTAVDHVLFVVGIELDQDRPHHRRHVRRLGAGTGARDPGLSALDDAHLGRPVDQVDDQPGRRRLHVQIHPHCCRQRPGHNDRAQAGNGGGPPPGSRHALVSGSGDNGSEDRLASPATRLPHQPGEIVGGNRLRLHPAMGERHYQRSPGSPAGGGQDGSVPEVERSAGRIDRHRGWGRAAHGASGESGGRSRRHHHDHHRHPTPKQRQPRLTQPAQARAWGRASSRSGEIASPHPRQVP
jgi:hypothetical protein